MWVARKEGYTPLTVTRWLGTRYNAGRGTLQCKCRKWCPSSRPPTCRGAGHPPCLQWQICFHCCCWWEYGRTGRIDMHIDTHWGQRCCWLSAVVTSRQGGESRRTSHSRDTHSLDAFGPKKFEAGRTSHPRGTHIQWMHSVQRSVRTHLVHILNYTCAHYRYCINQV